MMSLESIQALADRAAQAARDERRNPIQLFNPEEVLTGKFKLPLLGSYTPPGWELVDKHFADISGLGAPHEPALTQAQLLQVMAEETKKNAFVGWGITEVGQFQAYVGQYVPSTEEVE